jgi:peptide deformylase
MAKLDILEFPDPRLRTVAKPVESVDDDIRRLIDDMIETMYLERGIGLAATQVNVHQRLLVLDVSEDQDSPQAFINPEIIHEQGTQTCEEGCLSVPGVFAEVKRAEEIRIKALDGNGEAFEQDADGLLAVCLQHELDHLNGKLFVDYLSPLRRARVKKKLEKQRKAMQQESSDNPLF